VSGFLIPPVEDFVEKKLLEHFKFVRKKKGKIADLGPILANIAGTSDKLGSKKGIQSKSK